jgi:uncharacterized membrane protein
VVARIAHAIRHAYEGEVNMSDLVAITYPDVNQAGKVLDVVKRLVKEHLLEVDDAVYVTKDSSGEVDLHQMINLPATSAAHGGAHGALWGGLIGLLFLQPLAGMAIGAAIGAGTGAVAGTFTDYGIDDQFVKQLSTQMTPSSSAIFILFRRATMDKVVPELSKYGGTVLHTSLSDEAERRLQAALVQQTLMIPQATASDTVVSPTM